MTAPVPDILIAGGGLAGSLAALALAERRPDLSILLVEAGESIGGNHIWSFFDTDVAEADRWILEPLRPLRWRDHEVRFPRRSRRLGIGYNSVRSADLDAAVRARLHPHRLRLSAPIVEVRPGEVRLEGGETLRARAVIDARGMAPVADLDLAWQKFVGSVRRCAAPHGVERPLIMDARVDQSFGYRFVYCLPFSERELLVEDTYYADGRALDEPRLRRHIADYGRQHGFEPAEALSEETGVLPIVLDGRIDAFWPASEPPVARLGLRGGFFHPTTGYSLPDAVRLALRVARGPDLAALPGMLRAEAARLWRERGFYRLLNRMLFRAAAPAERYRVLEHFYRLDPATIERFYAAGSTAWDKVRIMSGRPPVPIGKALAQL